MLLKISKMTPRHPKQLPDHDYTRESRLTSDEYTRDPTSWCTLNKHQNRFQNKFWWLTDQGVKIPLCINHRGVLITWYIFPRNYFWIFKIFMVFFIFLIISSAKSTPGSRLESLRLGNVLKHKSASKMTPRSWTPRGSQLPSSEYTRESRLPMVNTLRNLNSPLMDTAGSQLLGVHTLNKH